MYPTELFGLFPPFPRDDRVFVAMSFNDGFQARWTHVIEPGIRDAGLEAFRVDASRVSDSILIEILKAISHSRLIFADVSDIGGIRNPNVMYEVGLAHAVRQPQEVILFRSDKERLLFDISNVRVNFYSPDGDPGTARRQIKNTMTEALHVVEVSKSLAVHRAVEALDQQGFLLLVEASAQGPFRHPKQSIVNIYFVNAVSRLLDLGLLATVYPNLAAEPEGAFQLDYFTYRITPLGEAVVIAIMEKFFPAESLKDPEVIKKLDLLFEKTMGISATERPSKGESQSE